MADLPPTDRKPRPHTLVVAIEIGTRGANLDAIITAIRDCEGVTDADECATYDHGDAIREVQVAVMVAAVEEPVEVEGACLACNGAGCEACGHTGRQMQPIDPDQPKEHGTDDVCPKNATGHEPDWRTVTVDSDGGETYVDVACKHCGRSGCVGSTVTLVKGMSW